VFDQVLASTDPSGEKFLKQFIAFYIVGCTS